ncbi:MAG: hypothetical protein AB7Q37_18695 [Pyrinomonadaceae bacterium]
MPDETVYMIGALSVVPSGHHGDTWALYNGAGDVVATGSYRRCVRLAVAMAGDFADIPE